MDYDLFKVVGAVAGIGGIALAAVVYIFREIIRKEIFPQLTKEQAYALLNRIVILIFVIGVLGVVAYLAVNWRDRDSREDRNPKETTTSDQPTADLSGTVLDENDKPLQGAKVTVDVLLGKPPVETSSDGFFHLKDIPKKYGEGVRIRVMMEGYQPNPYVEDVVLGASPPRIKLRRIK